jgi:hypothetical protein
MGIPGIALWFERLSHRYFTHHQGGTSWQRKNVPIHHAAAQRKKEKNFAPIHVGIRVYRDAVPATTRAARRNLPKKPIDADQAVGLSSQKTREQPSPRSSMGAVYVQYQ